jgi:hypothetical protein
VNSRDWPDLNSEEMRALRDRLIQECVVEEAEVDADSRLESGEFLRGETFVFSAWRPPPPEWVSVTRRDDGTVSAVSMRREPGPPSWSMDDPPAWDHDHCALCLQHLCDDPPCDEELSGWRTGEGWGSYTWVCTRCFKDFEYRLDWKRAEGSSVGG